MFSFEQIGRSLDNALGSLPSFDNAVKTVSDFSPLKSIKDAANSVSETVTGALDSAQKSIQEYQERALDSVQKSIQEYKERAENKRLWKESLEEDLNLSLDKAKEKVAVIDYSSVKVKFDLKG